MLPHPEAIADCVTVETGPACRRWWAGVERDGWLSGCTGIATARAKEIQSPTFLNSPLFSSFFTHFADSEPLSHRVHQKWHLEICWGFLYPEHKELQNDIRGVDFYLRLFCNFKKKVEPEIYVPWSPRTELGGKHSAVHSVTCKSLEVSYQKSYQKSFVQKNKRILKYFVTKHLFFPQSFLLIL